MANDNASWMTTASHCHSSPSTRARNPLPYSSRRSLWSTRRPGRRSSTTTISRWHRRSVRSTMSIPSLQVYNVFNVAAQTNLKESRPELYDKIVQENLSPKREAGETASFEPLDKMISGNLWFCPVKEVEGDNCYYSVSKDEIVLPPRATFVDGESFAGNFFHEATHSLGDEHRLNRLAGAQFGSKDYAVEELVAEMTASAVSSRYGMTKHVKEDSAAYLKSWLRSLNESPEFIKTVLTDVKSDQCDDSAHRQDSTCHR